jgi:predicted RNA-binding Zn-ribbon protein involved in translation (DUF1610 family)
VREGDRIPARRGTRRKAERSCPACGATLEDDARFCPKCGAEVMPREQPARDIPTFADKYNGYGKILGILSIFVLGWILGPLAIYYGSKARALDPRKGTAGIVLGAIGLVLWVVWIIVMIALSY